VTRYQPGDKVLVEATVTDVDPAPLGAITVTIPEATADGLTDGVQFTAARAVVMADPRHTENRWWEVEPPNEEDM
jgi:hypothetical protein